MKSKSTNPYSLRWYDPFFLRIIPPLAALLIKLLMLSCRVIKVEGQERMQQALERSGGKVVYRDGEYTARLAKWLGFKNVRGSSTRGGSTALKKMTRKIMEGEPGGVLADGPLGPARVAKAGSVFIARNAEAPLIPVLWGADRCWMLNTWDRYLVPKPFARVVFCYAEPIWVPHSANGEEFETYRSLFEKRMNLATRWCDEHFGLERPWRNVKKKGEPRVGPL